MGNKNLSNMKLSYLIRSTPFGPVAIVWSVFRDQPKIKRILLSKPNWSAENRLSELFPDLTRATYPDIDGIADHIEAFLMGEDINFSLKTICLDRCTPFQQNVLKAEHGIPRGSVSTYSRIARFLDKPNSARAVGNALAINPFPIVIPCHRAIRSDRSPGGYQGGIEMKRTLLKMEGIHFDETGFVITKNFFY